MKVSYYFISFSSIYLLKELALVQVYHLNFLYCSSFSISQSLAKWRLMFYSVYIYIRSSSLLFSLLSRPSMYFWMFYQAQVISLIIYFPLSVTSAAFLFYRLLLQSIVGLISSGFSSHFPSLQNCVSGASRQQRLYSQYCSKVNFFFCVYVLSNSCLFFSLAFHLLSSRFLGMVVVFIKEGLSDCDAQLYKQ